MVKISAEIVLEILSKLDQVEVVLVNKGLVSPNEEKEAISGLNSVKKSILKLYREHGE